MNLKSRLMGVLSYLFSFLTISIKFVLRLFQKTWKFLNSKKRYAIPFYMTLGYILFVTILIKTSGDSSFNKVLENKRINDVTAINPIQVEKIIRPESVDQISKAIQSSNGPISIGGGKFSMGGQTAYENSLHIDMRSFNKVLDLNTQLKQVTVQPGITWRDLQKVIDKENLSIKIMQTYANFTVGGSISVNCHGRYIGHGPIVSSVVNMKIVTASGEIVNVNRDENFEIFRAVAGGYGGIGVIVEATLQLVENVKVERQIAKVEMNEYNDFFNENIRDDRNVIFQNGDLYPPNYTTINNVSWIISEKDLTDTMRVIPLGEDYSLEQTLVEVVSWGDVGKWLRKKIMDPWYYSSDKIVWRNNEASYDVAELEPSSREKETYVLQEYFIPVNNIESFTPKMRDIYDKYKVNVINVSLRHAFPDHESYLSWAPEEVFAYVIYYKQGTDADSKADVKKWTVEMTDAILSENGSWYLPYQPHATVDQFNGGFSNAQAYFEVKNRLDSNHRFTNKLLDKYNPYLVDKIEKDRIDINGYFRQEEQTVLTVPEWYLVFNPKEYADFIENKNNPSDFPFYASLDEYWKLYDRSLTLVSEAYPDNFDYKAMLQIIGVSVTLEYAIKILYETTIGKLFGFFANGNMSTEEVTIGEAQRAYSDFIYHTAWYKFEFLPWVEKAWSVSDSSGGNFLRKWERLLVFTTEFTVKAGYAQLLTWGASASYDEPVTSIYMLTSNDSTLQENEDLKIVSRKGEKMIVGITRWGPFTEELSRIKDHDFTIFEIGGNDEIVVSILMDNSKSFDFEKAEILYESKVVTDPSVKRAVHIMHVNQLLPYLRYTQQRGYTLEHIYDY